MRHDKGLAMLSNTKSPATHAIYRAQLKQMISTSQQQIRENINATGRGFGIINTDPMTMNARIGSVFGAIFFGLITIQNIIRNTNIYFKSKLDAIIKLLLS
jgi:hypothetical protein